MQRRWIILALTAAAGLVAVVAWPREAAAPEEAPGDPVRSPQADGPAWPKPHVVSTDASAAQPDAGSLGQSAEHPTPGWPRASVEDEKATTRADRTTRKRRRLLDHMSIEPLGPHETQLTPEDVAEVFDQARNELHACMREHDISRRDFRESRREDRLLTFELDAEGRVQPGSLKVDPPLSEGLAECYVAGFDASRAPAAAGGQGARVEVDMPALQSRREARAAEDDPRSPGPPDP